MPIGDNQEIVEKKETVVQLTSTELDQSSSAEQSNPPAAPKKIVLMKKSTLSRQTNIDMENVTCSISIDGTSLKSTLLHTLLPLALKKVANIAFEHPTVSRNWVAQLARARGLDNLVWMAVTGFYLVKGIYKFTLEVYNSEPFNNQRTLAPIEPSPPVSVELLDDGNDEHNWLPLAENRSAEPSRLMLSAFRLHCDSENTDVIVLLDETVNDKNEDWVLLSLEQNPTRPHL